MKIKDYQNWVKEECILEELKQKGLINSMNLSFSGRGNLMDMETAPNSIFLKEIKLVNDKNEIKLICRTERGTSREGNIKSDNMDLLKEIKDELENLKGKSISKILSTRIKISRKFFAYGTLKNEK
jgi:hypothetical protein